jgi:hypothetical protein
MNVRNLSFALGAVLSAAVVWASAAPAAINPDSISGATWVIVGPCAACSGMSNETCPNGWYNGQPWWCPGGAFTTCTVNPPGAGTCWPNGGRPCTHPALPANSPCHAQTQDCV